MASLDLLLNLVFSTTPKFRTFYRIATEIPAARYREFPPYKILISPLYYRVLLALCHLCGDRRCGDRAAPFATIRRNYPD